MVAAGGEKNGRLGRFRTADLLCVREALSH
jgi:hypothetical protein